MKNNIEITDNSDTGMLEEYYPERPLSEKETFELDRNVGKKIISSKKSILKVISHLKALRRYLMDSDVKWYKKSIVVAALIYFVTPFDAMPDFAPFVGYLDDIGVIAWTIKFLGSEITSYYY